MTNQPLRLQGHQIRERGHSTFDWTLQRDHDEWRVAIITDTYTTELQVGAIQVNPTEIDYDVALTHYVSFDLSVPELHYPPTGGPAYHRHSRGWFIEAPTARRILKLIKEQRP